ncbi:MAG: ABC-ATPase domain-containing protein, partial [Lachnospiraceae bacterium]|nr:ABC-ATPase domain-containing protein [Lachnospiraceae bacterium]
MRRFKSIILKMQGHNKKDLHLLYNTLSDIEPPKVYDYSGLKFWFAGTGWRTSEKLLLYVEIPGRFLPGSLLPGREMSGQSTATDVHAETGQSTGTGLPEENGLPQETYLLRLLSPAIAELSESYVNIDKNVREKAQFEVQKAGEYMIRRSGMRYDREKEAYILRMNFNVPLVNALSVNAKAAVRAVRDILDTIETALKEADPEELERYIRTYEVQCRIRRFMKEHDMCAFIGDGSILPRENGTAAPMQDAVPFVAPEELAVWIPLSENSGREIRGMGIRKGVTVITGGGYSGKSTLLDAIEMGIYDHIPGDGREFVLTEDSALKVYAEDGRPVSGLDLSPFFRFLPGKAPLRSYTTPHASGSVSQAANIIEAVCGKCCLLLIDEDKSATNFMIRDKNMRHIVRDEPIIPFTDRVRELYEKEEVSTILVIGGSSEYLACADTVLLLVLCGAVRW